jgi:hypothetical protein
MRARPDRTFTNLERDKVEDIQQKTEQDDAIAGRALSCGRIRRGLSSRPFSAQVPQKKEMKTSLNWRKASNPNFEPAKAAYHHEN